jgi:hypothetical protein
MITAASPHQPTEELDPLVGFIPVAGPPVLILAVPLVLVGLIVAGPFVLILTLVALVALVLAVLAAAGLVLASPYLLVRHLRARRAVALAPAPATTSRLAPAGVRTSAPRAVA